MSFKLEDNNSFSRSLVNSKIMFAISTFELFECYHAIVSYLSYEVTGLLVFASGYRYHSILWIYGWCNYKLNSIA